MTHILCVSFFKLHLKHLVVGSHTAEPSSTTELFLDPFTQVSTPSKLPSTGIPVTQRTSHRPLEENRVDLYYLFTPYGCSAVKKGVPGRIKKKELALE